MSLLRNDNVLWYHPLDDTTEYIKNHIWDDIQSNILFSGGIITSGLTRSSTSTGMDLEESLADGGYTDIDGATRFTTCFWASGYYQDNSSFKTINIGFEDGTVVRNVLKLQKTNTNDLKYNMRFGGNTLASKTISSRPTDDGWNFVVLDTVQEGSDWRMRISFNGEDWQDLGTVAYASLPDSNLRALINVADTSSDRFVLDEVVVWKDSDLFTSSELSNLYELANTHSLPMNQYSSIFPTPANSGIDCFIHGHLQTSGNIGLYIPGQKETRSIDLYMAVMTPSSGSIDDFIHGHIIFSGSMDQYIQGVILSSGDADLYIFGVPVESSSITLYTAGPIPSSGNVDDFIWGHLPASGNFSLFIAGIPDDFSIFVSVSDNNPSDNIDLFIYGVPPGESDTFYTNNTVTLFIKDDGDDNFSNSSWSVFARTADSIAASGIDAWQSFVRVGNSKNNDIGLFIYGHAPGEAPHGILVSGSISTFIAGQATQSGDEGLLSDGYSVSNIETPSFARVHFGSTDTLSLYVSGEVAVIPPSAILNLFIFGILDNTSGSFDSYMFGQDVINNNNNLFIFGIQDLEFDSITLYMEVTNIGLFNQESTLYSHGF